MHSSLFNDEDLPSLQENGIDPDAPLPDDDEQELVQDPEVELPLSDTSMQVLSTSIDPSQHSDVYGIHLYLRTVTLLHTLMSRDGLL